MHQDVQWSAWSSCIQISDGKLKRSGIPVMQCWVYAASTQWDSGHKVTKCHLCTYSMYLLVFPLVNSQPPLGVEEYLGTIKRSPSPLQENCRNQPIPDWWMHQSTPGKDLRPCWLGQDGWIMLLGASRLGENMCACFNIWNDIKCYACNKPTISSNPLIDL